MSKLSITCCLFSPRKKMLCGKRVCSSSHSQFQKYFSLISPQHAKDIVHSTWMATRVPKRQAFVQQGFCAQWTGQQTEGKRWLVLSRDTFDLYTLIIEQRKKKKQIQHSTKFYTHIQVQSSPIHKQEEILPQKCYYCSKRTTPISPPPLTFINSYLL